MRKLNNKGFTLVEIVIVIVIIAILAAMLVPALTQWIDKSKMKTFNSACGTIKTAVWAQVADNYAVSGNKTVSNWDTIGNDVGKTVSNSDGSGVYRVSGLNFDNDQITVQDQNFKGVWNGSAWTITKEGYNAGS